ncbi:10363_t:CDS:2 [Ambispora leptoticha]|uniref:10363_t:CDS:1 n=1 Tax=Ambispora leptoticha TaxID=144679 RepID=A0A9N8WIY7_9GLOM|nr:10363_t:CDS:2 [Ambispora leptoticha]
MKIGTNLGNVSDPPLRVNDSVWLITLCYIPTNGSRAQSTLNVGSSTDKIKYEDNISILDEDIKLDGFPTMNGDVGVREFYRQL